jgi:hypothetical protein
MLFSQKVSYYCYSWCLKQGNVNNKTLASIYEKNDCLRKDFFLVYLQLLWYISSL